MDILLWIVGGIVVVFGILILVGRRALRPGIDPTTVSFDPTLMQRVGELATSDRKVEAIKSLRDGTPGLGLADAKLIVDRMAAAAKKKPPAPDTAPSGSPLSLEVELQAHGLLREGKKINAIKLVREHTGWSLADAKNYVESL